ncbi:hypothetical protein EYC80_000699 [Monilinia laxa]|uniref:Uncharacterized protein n=1 Tax=Monilinia laxa TaxID=61186 RepID=A0A5N6KCN6_MONLA|nr:hypothetical protein EYC80_000699 [Monilinia laxa]
MHIITSLPLTLLILLTPILALDYISTYNLNSARWDANLIDTSNNISCNVTYDDTSSLLIADSHGYLTSQIAIVLPCDDKKYVATTIVGVNNSTVGYTVPGKEEFVFQSGERSVLEDGEVIQMVYGVKMD